MEVAQKEEKKSLVKSDNSIWFQLAMNLFEKWKTCAAFTCTEKAPKDDAMQVVFTGNVIYHQILWASLSALPRVDWLITKEVVVNLPDEKNSPWKLMYSGVPAS